MLVALPASMFFLSVAILGSGFVKNPEDESRLFRVVLRTQAVPDASLARLLFGVAGLSVSNAGQVLWLVNEPTTAIVKAVTVYFLLLGLGLMALVREVVRLRSGATGVSSSGKPTGHKEVPLAEGTKPTSDAGGVVVACVTRRAAAWILDLFGLIVVVVAVAFVLNLGHQVTSQVVRGDGTTGIVSDWAVEPEWTGSLLAVVSLAYSVACWRLLGYTIAQRAFGLYVFHAGRASTVGYCRAVARWLGLFGWTFVVFASAFSPVSWPLALITLVWFGVLLITTVRSKTGQGFHDRLGQTLVVAFGS
jgi:hypothetical protein